MKTLTVGQEDDQLPSLPPKGVERNQREPADLTGISGAAAGEDLQPACQEQQIQYPLVVKGLGTSLGRDIRKKRTNYQVVDQTETPSRDPRNIGSEATPVARQLQFHFTTGEETRLLERRRKYGKRQRDSDQDIHYAVEAIINTDSSTIDSRRNEELEGVNELQEIEEIVTVQANEEIVPVQANAEITTVQVHEVRIPIKVTEEEEQEADQEAEELELKELEEEERGATVRRTRSLEAATKLIKTTEEDDQEAVDTPVKEASFSETPIAETDADFHREVGTVINLNAAIEEEEEKTVSSGQVSPIPDLVVVNQRTEEQQPLTPIQQDESLEVELLGTLKDVIVSEEHPAFSVEIVLGPGGVYTTRYPTGRHSHDDPEDLNDGSAGEPLSEKAEEVQEATILVPKVITKAVKSIHSSPGSTERGEEGQEAEVSGEERRSAAETPPESEETEGCN